MNFLKPHRENGFSILEIVIAVTILVIVLTYALRNYNLFLQNQINISQTHDVSRMIAEIGTSLSSNMSCRCNLSNFANTNTFSDATAALAQIDLTNMGIYSLEGKESGIISSVSANSRGKELWIKGIRLFNFVRIDANSHRGTLEVKYQKNMGGELTYNREVLLWTQTSAGTVYIRDCSIFDIPKNAAAVPATLRCGAPTPALQCVINEATAPADGFVTVRCLATETKTGCWVNFPPSPPAPATTLQHSIAPVSITDGCTSNLPAGGTLYVACCTIP